MPNRLIVNSTNADVTVNTLTCPARSSKVLNVATDADLAAWVGTAGVAAVAAPATSNDNADYINRRAIARTMKYERVL